MIVVPAVGRPRPVRRAGTDTHREVTSIELDVQRLAGRNGRTGIQDVREVIVDRDAADAGGIEVRAVQIAGRDVCEAGVCRGSDPVAGM